MGYRSNLIKKNFLIKRINKLNDYAILILRIRFFRWYSYCTSIKEKAQYKIALFIERTYKTVKARINWIKLSNTYELYWNREFSAIIISMLKERRKWYKVNNIMLRLMNNLNDKNDLLILQNYIYRWSNKVDNIIYREEKLNAALTLIEDRQYFLDIITMENIFNKKKEIDILKSKIYHTNFFPGLIIIKRIVYDYLKRFFYYFIKIIIEVDKNLQIEELNEKIIQYEKLLDNNYAIKMIESKDKEINELKQSLSRFPFQLSKEEQLMSVIFQSDNQEIHSSIICKNTDNFTTVVNSLFDKFPKYRKLKCFFLFRGNKIDEYNTLKDLNIQDGDIIILNQFE